MQLKGIGGVDHVFYKLILFYRVLTELQVAFYRFKKFKLFFELWLVNLHNRYLIGRENKYGKKSLFHLKSISSFIFQAILLKFLENGSHIIIKGTFPKNLSKTAWKMKEKIDFKVISRYLQFYFAPPIRNLLCCPTLTGHISKNNLNFFKRKKNNLKLINNSLK